VYRRQAFTLRLRGYWPHTRIVWRGDSHYGHVEAMEWTKNNGADYIFGLQGNAALVAIQLVGAVARVWAKQVRKCLRGA
jgi:hypothetical protein